MITLQQVCEDYIASNPRLRSPHSMRLLRISVRHFDEWLGRPATIADLTDVNLTAYSRRRGNECAAATVERECSKIATLWRWAALHGHCQPPTIRIDKATTGVPVAWTRNEVRDLFSAARQLEGTIGGVACRVYFPALLGVLWDSGERIGALVAVRRSDISITRRWLLPDVAWVIFRIRKGNGRPLVRRLRQSTIGPVRRLLDAHDYQQPFGHVHRTTIYHHFDRLLRSADLPVDRKHKFHCTRRTVASHLKRKGIANPLGHSSETIAERYYYDPRITDTRQPADHLFDPLGLWGKISGLLETGLRH